MEAKDTVVRDKCHCNYNLRDCVCGCPDCGTVRHINQGKEAQAEISFKTGMKEVVDWINANSQAIPIFWADNVKKVIEMPAWQAKLKEWGIG